MTPGNPAVEFFGITGRHGAFGDLTRVMFTRYESGLVGVDALPLLGGVIVREKAIYRDVYVIRVPGVLDAVSDGNVVTIPPTLRHRNAALTT